MLAWLMLAAIVCAAALVGGVMTQVTFEAANPQILMPTVEGALCVLAAAMAGLGLFAYAAVRTPASAPVALLAGSTVRMFVSLSLALAVYFLGRMDKPTGMVFWIVFLACGLAAIVAEAAWGVKNLNRPVAPASASTNLDSPSRAAAAIETH